MWNWRGGRTGVHTFPGLRVPGMTPFRNEGEMRHSQLQGIEKVCHLQERLQRKEVTSEGILDIRKEDGTRNKKYGVIKQTSLLLLGLLT